MKIFFTKSYLFNGVKQIAIPLFLFLAAGQLPAQTWCDAHFTHQAGSFPNSVVFTPAPNPTGTHFYWSFGDGSYSDLAHPTHIYTGPGKYYVCLTVIDTISNSLICTAQWCDTIAIGTINQICNAKFTWGPGTTINNISFHSAPNPPGTTYSWTFGDGGTSVDANPNHTYASPGAYYVCLTVTNTTSSGICRDTKCDSVKVGVQPPPVCNAHFTWGPCSNSNSCISFHSMLNPPGTHYYWTFGDGGKSDNPNPSHTYLSAGTYVVCLTVIDTLSSGICKDQWCDTVKVGTPPPPPCDAHFGHYSSSTNPDSVRFYPTGNNPTGTHYEWNFGDGKTSTDQFPMHFYASPGTYYVCLTVVVPTSSGNCTSKWCDSVKVVVQPPAPPVCNAHFKFQVYGNNVVFQSPPNPPGTHYFWTFGDGGTSTNVNPGHTYASAGTYWVCLVVEDSTASGKCRDKWCDSVKVLSPNLYCNAHFTWTSCSNINCVSFHSPPNHIGTHYYWTFGDGTFSDNPNPNHVYASAGTYYVCLTVVDTTSAGICKDHWCDSVKIGTVSPPKCNAHFIHDPTTTLKVVFHGSLNPPGTQYFWTFGDGGTSNTINPTHTYNSPGTYWVCLTVVANTNSGSCTAKWCDSVKVGPRPNNLYCNAHFRHQPTTTKFGIRFISALNPPGTHYYWTFGDGGTSNNPNPFHVYPSSGTYQVCLTVIDTSSAGICKDTWCDSVKVLQPPPPPPPPPPLCNAQFKYYYGTVPPLSVTFIAAPNLPGTTYSWDFGDGGTSNYTNPIHVYASAGTYRVCLSVQRIINRDTCRRTWCTVITVKSPAPFQPSSDDGSELRIQSENSIAVMVYPNPMKEYATVSLLNTLSSDQITFSLYDNTGRMVFKKESISEGSFTISSGDLRPGLYFYIVNDSGRVISNGKLIVQQ